MIMCAWILVMIIQMYQIWCDMFLFTIDELDDEMIVSLFYSL